MMTTSPPTSDASRPYLTVVLPIYQEREAIEEVLTEVFDTLGESEYTFELVAVDDGSTDGTADVLRAVAERLGDRMRVVTHPYNKGHGSALKTGVLEARGETVAFIDGDGQHDPRDLAGMVQLIGEFDLVVGARIGSNRGKWHRNLGNTVYNIIASWVAKFRIEDLTSGYRVFRAPVIRRYLHLFPARFSTATTTTLAFIKAGHNVKFVPTNPRQRLGGESKIHLARDGSKFFVIMIKILVIFEPLRVFLPVAIVLFLLGIVSTATAVWSADRLVVPNSAATLFVISVVVFLLGLIAEQIAALQLSDRDRSD
jgi:glycosyltransferase involved in cell wall biosynthesis